MWFSMKWTAALLYLSALTISRGSQCEYLCIQPVLPAVNDGLPFAVRGYAVLIEGLRQPFGAADLGHADTNAELLRQLSEYSISLLQQLFAGAFGSGGIDADSALAHLMHHRQQIDLEPIGRARAFLVEYWIEAFQ